MDAEFTLVTDLARDFFKRSMVGRNLDGGFNLLVEDLRSSYCAPSVQSLIVALHSARAGKGLTPLLELYDDVPQFCRLLEIQILGRSSHLLA